MDSTALTPVLPKLNELVSAATYAADMAKNIHDNGMKIVSDLEQVEKALHLEADTIEQEARERSAALRQRAAEVRAMIDYHTVNTSAPVELPALQKAA